MNDLTVIRFAGHCFSSEDVALMCQAARDYASLGISEIARTVCEWLDWKRPNGRLKNHECRLLLERLRDQGVLSLPPLCRSGRGGARSVDWLELSTARSELAIYRQQQPLPDFAVGAREGTGIFHSGARHLSTRPRLVPTVWVQADAAGEPRRCSPVPRNLLSRCQLDLCWRNFRTRADGSPSSNR